MRLIIAILMFTMLTGCVSMEQRKATFNQSLDIYVGKNADDLVLAKGPPTSSFTLSTGAKVFEYSNSQSVTRGGNSYTTMQPMFVPGANGGGSWMSIPTQRTTPLSSYEYFCKVLFKISAANIVESWSAQGNGCY
ncbi:hypothetical protein [Sulfuriferula nivalis]|uniref:Lipoprotein n=1 Tax=Sulfuriferula nivalis TaxID=2675298 RepID=A0A809REK0_9PROT|nr:hypothetical protein [Sulfuriferula nivalis]BBP00209.1 hypothetical protein SFSGTM_09170 [Sulfuriferula nivalis]